MRNRPRCALSALSPRKYCTQKNLLEHGLPISQAPQQCRVNAVFSKWPILAQDTLEIHFNWWELKPIYWDIFTHILLHWCKSQHLLKLKWVPSNSLSAKRICQVEECTQGVPGAQSWIQNNNHVQQVLTRASKQKEGRMKTPQQVRGLYCNICLLCSSVVDVHLSHELLHVVLDGQAWRSSAVMKESASKSCHPRPKA